ncbi:protein tantalus [Scaptodrosophila lebanonensis]|uniref:Protein tantalus n=1 Tax=Drosophila lebanonensis TaxID=7225 RepID=A0A6J2UDX5_DROLE|nr:protein tantalus [Scaptodrosophila lebanonensis]
MDNIVYNFSRITFQPKPKEVVVTQNRSSMAFSSATTNASGNNFSWSLKQTTTASSGGTMNDEMQDTTDTTNTTSEDEQEVEETDAQLSCDEESSDSHSSCGSHMSSLSGRRSGVARRRMPSRASKDAFNRVSSIIMKPNKKKRKETLSTNAQTLKSIEKLYTNKRMKKLTPTNLETIFEEPSDENAADAEDDSEECGISSQVRLVTFGARKLRRAISFSDGLNKNKALVKKRRQKVKKAFGKRFALKKISMSEFHDRLNKSFDSAMLEGEEAESEIIANGHGRGSGGAATLAKSFPATMDDMQLPALAEAATMQTPAFE